ncbi:histidine phosphatase family protein [Dermatophilus congolensis]|uniref:Bifunctional RNase H/acid phosphatase n=1 Tax=Dermatophilus congolensis TaxID=1863 RepID=A0A239VB53_9MICO|nr:histidine phosphatase family protein [Dermatophilus congolensis]MBO3128459.1 histidine phosphatase family protein [Dermatophilus congolensis]MBO3132902.1 histidine phosphatase family protein [Dermatophilus congolensis]MBO3132939.1 histidine phosphatase family protein [Dermatophilus congolensis]MBO3135176.1 histidine phosphatase family protein [Dermatophilus congolensis]MBO3137414.1 histidine phosphatase family protein [Dermatophilus congolensis]
MSTSSKSSRETTVHFLRHGEVYNPARIIYGRLPNYHLSERGHAMAELAAQSLRNFPIGLVVSSPLERAQETAQPVAATHNLPIYTDPRIIEAQNSFEGHKFGQGQASLRNPATWKLIRNPFRPSWGEPYTHLATRMREALHAAVEASHRLADGADVVAVSHQLPIWELRLSVEGRRLWHDPRKRECGLASITSFTLRDHEIIAIAYSEPAAELYPGSTGGVGA